MTNKEKLFQKWKNHITDDLIFTDLCNKVLWFNVPSEDRLKLILYGAEKAKDKGADAELDGTFMEQKGKWIFQYKFFDLSKNTQTNARYRLKRSLLTGNKRKKEIPELEKAMMLNPTKYVIFTNIQLTKHNIDEILEKSKKMGVTFDIILRDIENLDPIILNEPLLEISFFGSKPFYCVKEFQEQFKNEGRIVGHDFKLYGRGEEKKQFQNFIDGEKNVLILTGAAGVGKTRFIIEMAEELQNSDVVPIFLRSDMGIQDDDVLKISETKSRYVIFIDDAHDYDKIHSLLKLASYKKYEKFKFVLTTRTQLEEYITASANPEDLELLRLDPFPQKTMSEFLQNELNVTDSKSRLHIWQLSGGLPLFAILFSVIVKEKKLQPLNITKEELIKYWIKKILSDLKENNQKNEIDFLKVLAAIEPVFLSNEELLEQISKFLNVQDYELERIINHLCELGYIKKFGRIIKINHDIIGNYLLYQTNVENPQILSKIRDTFLKYEPKNVLTNLAKAEYLGQNDLLSQFLRESLEEIPSLNIPQRLTIVESLGTLAFFRPSEVLEIVKNIMRVPAGKYTDENGIFGEVDLTNENVLKEIPPVLRNVSFSFEDLKGAMNLLKEIELVGDTPDNYSTSAKSILRDDIVGYQALKPIIFNEKALEVLKGWVDEKKTEVDELIIDSLGGIFAREIHETLPSDEGPTAFQLRRYKVNREHISRLRIAAINLLIDIAKSREKSTCTKALNQLCINDPDYEELKIILDFVDRCIKKKNDLSVLHSLNHTLAHFRSCCDLNLKSEFVEKIDLLTNRLESSNFEYTLYRWFVGMGAVDIYSHDDKKFDLKVIEEKIKYLAIKVPEKISSNNLGGVINRIFDEGGEIPINSVYFSVFLGEYHPRYAMDLLRFFVDNEICNREKSAFIGGLIKGIEKTEQIEAKSIVNEIYSIKDCWWNVIVRYLFICEEDIDKYYFEMLQKIASDGLEETKLLLVDFLGSSLSPKLENDEWWAIIATITKNDNKAMDKQIAGSVYRKIDKNLEEFEKHLDEVKEVVQKFERSNDLYSGTMDWFYLGKTMNLIFKFDSLWVLDFFKKRIELWAEVNAPKDFRPIPFGSAMEYVFEGIKEDDKKLKETIRWILSLAKKDPRYLFESSIIFVSISPTIDNKIKDILLDWAKEDIENRLVTVAFIIRDCENDQSFFDLSRDILELSKGNDEVLSSLSASIHTMGGTAWSFVPILEERKKIMEEWMKSQKSWVRMFAKKEIELFKREIQFEKDEEEEIFYA